MTSSPSDPWGVPSPQPDDPWSVPPKSTPPGQQSTPPGQQSTPPGPWDAPHIAGAAAVPPDQPTEPQPYQPAAPTPWGQPTEPQPYQPPAPTPSGPPYMPAQPSGPSSTPSGPPYMPAQPSGPPYAPAQPSTSLTPASVPPAYGVPQQPGPVIVQIAEISVTSTTIFTPTGDIPLAGSQWQVNDYWFAQQRIPKYAIVLAIVGFCVLTVLSLLFLLIKETVMQGTVQVTVTNGTRQYVARIPVTDQNAVTTINQQVNYVRTLAAL
jgi:hypothetical protein